MGLKLPTDQEIENAVRSQLEDQYGSHIVKLMEPFITVLIDTQKSVRDIVASNISNVASLEELITYPSSGLN